MKEVKRANASIPDAEQHCWKQVAIKNKVLYIDTVPPNQKVHVHPPTASEILNIEPEVHNKMEQLNFVHTEVETEKGSHLRGHEVHIKQTSELKIAYHKIKAMFAECDHVVLSHSVRGYTGQNDNGEYGVSRRMFKILMESGMTNVAVFVTREYGRHQLGQRRGLFT